MLVRDGFPCKTSKNHQELNYRLVLQAARDIMDVATYKRFKVSIKEFSANLPEFSATYQNFPQNQ